MIKVFRIDLILAKCHVTLNTFILHDWIVWRWKHLARGRGEPRGASPEVGQQPLTPLTYTRTHPSTLQTDCSVKKINPGDDFELASSIWVSKTVIIDIDDMSSGISLE